MKKEVEIGKRQREDKHDLTSMCTTFTYIQRYIPASVAKRTYSHQVYSGIYPDLQGLPNPKPYTPKPKHHPKP